MKRRFKDDCATLVARLMVKSQLQGAAEGNRRITHISSQQRQFYPLYPFLSSPVSAPNSASLNGEIWPEIRPARGDDERRRCAYRRQVPASPILGIPYDPSGDERLVVPEMDAGPKNPVGLPEAGMAKYAAE